MQTAIRKAHTACTDHVRSRAETAEDKQRLKIFVAPEFYFRGKSGAYDMGARGNSEVLDTALKRVGSPGYVAIDQKSKYFPKQGHMTGYNPVDIP